MNVEISLYNNYYPWTKVKSGEITCWVKGTLFYDNKLISNDEVVSIFSSLLKGPHLNQDSLKDLLFNLNGNFAIVIETPRYVFGTVDRVRSIPLFYTANKEEPIISDDANHIRSCMSTTFNEENGAEFLVTGFVTGSETLFNEIFQLQASEYLIYDKNKGSLYTSYYHHFWHNNYLLNSEDEMLNKLDKTFINVFQRLIESTRGYPIVVPLSGGIDSRVIVAMLKRLGVENVICFTYGKKGDKEAVISKKVAETLGYRWYFVEYTHKNLYDCYDSGEMKKFFEYAGNLVSSPHIQDFFAVKELKKEGKIPKNAIFVPGHSGDMLAGSHIPLVLNQNQDYDLEKFLKDTIKKHYSLWKWDDNKLESQFKKKILKSVGYISVHDNESSANAIELFDYNERQAKFIVNSIRVYEFFRYDWRLPLWDSELINFFLKVPFFCRINLSLYKKFAREILFTGSLQDLAEIECTTSFVDNSKFNKLSVSRIINFLTSRWNMIFDIRWGRYYKHPTLHRFFRFGYVSNDFKKDTSIYNIIENNKNDIFRRNFNGYNAKVYLEIIIGTNY